MELTKDELYRIRYNEYTNTLEIGKKQNKGIAWIKKNKLFSIILGLTAVFILTDFFLLFHFMSLLSMI